MTRPPSPCSSALAARRAPGATLTMSAWRTSGLRPWKSPPTRTWPPPALPDASSTACWSSRMRCPCTSTSPPRLAGSAPVASSVLAMRVMPSSPPSMTMRPPRSPIDRACTRPSTLSTVSARPARAAARSSMLPPSARTWPSWARRVGRPALRTLKKTRPSPSTSTSTSPAAASPTRRASMLPLWVSCGATSATVPSVAVMLPSARSSPAPAPWPSCSRPDVRSPWLMDSVLATRLPTSTRELGPKTMPRGLISQTRPLLLREP